MKTKAVLFDNDGTLLDSLPIAYESACAVLKSAGCSYPDFQEYLRTCHPPFSVFYERYGLIASEAELWRQFNAVVDFDHSELFSDTLDTLERLRSNGSTLGLISAQFEHVVHYLCGRQGIMRFFKAGVVGGASDKAEAIIAMCREVNISPSHAYYVGDCVSDITSARKAGVKAIGITRGNDTEAVLRDAGAEVIITHLDELERHLWETLSFL